MHFVLGICAILASIKWANWKEWSRYYPTILYIVVSNLLYKFFAYYKFHLWKLSSNDFFFDSHMGIFLWHIFIINTMYTFIYLSNFPEESGTKKFIYILKWLAFFMVLEVMLLKLNHVDYLNGWNLWWTLIFDIVMFLMLRLHYKNPLLAIILSIANTLFYLIVFGYLK